MKPDAEDRTRYRAVIDQLVDDCRSGQGQIGASRARRGIWNENRPPDLPPEQDRINRLLGRLSPEDRETLARMLEVAFVGGVHAALVALHEQEIPPFEDGYEGPPFHDFMGRLTGWEWPER